MCRKAHSALTAPLVFHDTRIYKCAMKKFGFNCQLLNEPFLIVNYLSSLVKDATNAARICKLRNGLKKRLNSYIFNGQRRTNCAMNISAAI
jgi:hypothetical protein